MKQRWDDLEQRLRAHPSVVGSSVVLELIAEVRTAEARAKAYKAICDAVYEESYPGFWLTELIDKAREEVGDKEVK